MTSRSHYSQELMWLQRDILKMGCMMEEAINNSIKALISQNIELAQDVISGDDELDDFEISIENKCVKLIATEQPVAKDLRIILTALKIITDLERMSDHAVDIAKIAIRLSNEQYMKPIIDIPKMADIAMKMVRDSLKAYIEQDINLAEKICADDDTVDSIYSQLFDELTGLMMNGKENIIQGSYFLFVARYLERVADHATNVCEWVIYLATGERENLNV